MTVRYRGGWVGVNSAPPVNPRRRHESPKWGDAQGAIKRSKGQCLDINQIVIWLYFVVGGKRVRKPVPVAAHWTTIGRNGYTHTTQGRQKGLRKLTRAEKRRSIQWWVNRYGGDVKALNSLRKKGRKKGKPNNYPMTWGQQVRYASRQGAVLTPELKSPAFAREDVAEHMVTVCRNQDYPLWPMTLLWMKDARGKCAAFRKAGAHFAIIFGNRRWMARGKSRVENWVHKPTRVWGPKSARQWLG